MTRFLAALRHGRYDLARRLLRAAAARKRDAAHHARGTVLLYLGGAS